jgi:small subunit ribosomal protein S24e
MEIEIDSKKNNPLLNRTEIYFTVKHLGEKTPNREIIRAEIADKINVKKEDVIVDSIHTTFGIQQITGYAKVYTSSDKTKSLERKHILIRNKLMQSKKKEKKEETKAAKPPVEVVKQETKPAKEEPKPQTPKAEDVKKEPKEKPVEPQPKDKKE